MCGTDLAYEDEMCGTHADLVYGGTRRKGVQVQHVAAQVSYTLAIPCPAIVLHLGYRMSGYRPTSCLYDVRLWFVAYLSMSYAMSGADMGLFPALLGRASGQAAQPNRVRCPVRRRLVAMLSVCSSTMSSGYAPSARTTSSGNKDGVAPTPCGCSA
eukprot:341606-Rhodomonas_salina.1